jgi:RHS repeat-associated protein
VVGRIRYTPFGEIIEQTGVVLPRGYTGEFQNPVNNLTYLRARYYDPKLGRFLTQDSIIPDLLNGQAWNTYAYVYNEHGNTRSYGRMGGRSAPEAWFSQVRAAKHACSL